MYGEGEGEGVVFCHKVMTTLGLATLVHIHSMYVVTFSCILRVCFALNSICVSADNEVNEDKLSMGPLTRFKCKDGEDTTDGERVWIDPRNLTEVFEAMEKFQGQHEVKLVVGNTSSGYYKDIKSEVFINIAKVWLGIITFLCVCNLLVICWISIILLDKPSQLKP